MALVIAGCRSTNGLGSLPYPFDNPGHSVNSQARTLEQQQLESLIENIVSTLEVDGSESKFDDWDDGPIVARYSSLNLATMDSPYGASTDKKYIVQNEDFDTYFQANFKASNIGFFLPKACSDSIDKLRSQRILLRGSEGRLNYKSYTKSPPLYELGSSELSRLHKKYSRSFYFLPCRNGVNIRMYSSELDRQLEKNYVPDLDKDFWIGISIYRPNKNFKEIIHSSPISQ